MKNIARKKKPNNVLSLVDNSKFKTNQINHANESLFSYKMVANMFQFQIGDSIICRRYCNEELSPNALVICQCERSGKHLTTVANAENITAIVVAFKREVAQ